MDALTLVIRNGQVTYLVGPPATTTQVQLLQPIKVSDVAHEVQLKLC